MASSLAVSDDESRPASRSARLRSASFSSGLLRCKTWSTLPYAISTVTDGLTSCWVGMSRRLHQVERSGQENAHHIVMFGGESDFSWHNASESIWPGT